MRRAQWGWMAFDWAAQPIFTLMLSFIFAPYFAAHVASDPVTGQTQWGVMSALVGITVALTAPLLGAIADGRGARRPYLLGFSLLYMAGTAATWWAVPQMANPWPVLIAFGLALVAAELAAQFTNAMLPDLAAPDEIGRLSGAGWALGYAGGVVALVIALLFFAENDAGRTFLGTAPVLGLDPETYEGTRAIGPLTALWFALFMLPFFAFVPDRGNPAGTGLRGLLDTLKSLPGQGNLARFLLASMAYRDALAGLFIFGGIYGTGMLGLPVEDIGKFGIIAALTGALGAWVGGHLDSRLGPRPVIMTALPLLILACTAVMLTDPRHVVGVPVAGDSPLPRLLFFSAGALIGAAAGPLQAASRSLLVQLSNPERMTESFGLYAFAGKATAFVVPALVALVTDLSGSQRLGFTPVILLFVVGYFLLMRVSCPRNTE